MLAEKSRLLFIRRAPNIAHQTDHLTDALDGLAAQGGKLVKPVRLEPNRLANSDMASRVA